MTTHGCIFVVGCNMLVIFKKESRWVWGFCLLCEFLLRVCGSSPKFIVCANSCFHLSVAHDDWLIDQGLRVGTCK